MIRLSISAFALGLAIVVPADGENDLPGAPISPRGEPAGDQGFTSIFDGKTLSGWHALPAATERDWVVRDGVIIGTGSQDRQSYLVWKEQDLTDFELELKFRLPAGGNTGIEIR